MPEGVIAGVDLTAGPRPSACAALEPDLSVRSTAMLGSDAELLDFTRTHGAEVVAIDAPLSLPAGLCCLEESCPCQPLRPLTGRECERALAALGIGCFWTSKRSIIKRMVYRAIQLKQALEASGCAVIEVYPYATKRRLFGRLPRKSTAAGLAELGQALNGLLGTSGKLTHDEADALLCAYTGWLYQRGRTEALGKAAEGQIHIPR